MRNIQLMVRAGGLFGSCFFTGLIFIAGYVSCTKTTALNSTPDSTYLGRLPFVIKANASFGFYDSTLKLTGWQDSLAGSGPYTILLPNNDAYNAGYLMLPPCCGTPDYLNGFITAVGQPALSSYVTYDILKGKIYFRALPLGENQEMSSITGAKIYVTRYLSGADTVTTVNGQQVISIDNRATNGLIQVLTGIPNPAIYPDVLQQIRSDTSLAYFAAALQRTHLDTLLSGEGPFTVLAPTNNAFRVTAILGVNLGVNIASLDSIIAADPAILTNIIRYHILPGRYFLNDFVRQFTTDTLSLTMLNGEVMQFATTANQGGYFPISPVSPGFFGKGNFSYQAAAIISYTPFYTGGAGYQANDGDRPTRNGVVDPITNVLIP